ncbi:DUF6359 domain-containing protein [Pullulanibacillus sp. KACC 23026]|uniref:DUF6359 domain-containing protein n=1 Tax=Pullulanibacillus sp. KACC 23026 TaxID=3028315 RepID=UPI0023AF79F6|nr:DUF6359 domain-containing protein [Pullulanibacillus sp. KACC 23026]WEG11864.1 DUF6359 domain-containing protein [Pullulanibacillus sp. KACC 23026]
MKIGRLLKLLLAIMIAIPFSSLVLIAGNQAQAATTDGAMTVAEALASNANDGSTGTVEGYIVAHATGSKMANFSAAFSNDYNVLIADSPDETDLNKMMDVQLKTASDRSEFGLHTNSDNIGKKIEVTGSFSSYNSFPGILAPSSISFVDDTSTPSNPTSDTLTIAQVRALADDTTATFTGVVTTKSGAFGGKSVYVQDDTGGIYLYQDSNDSVDLTPGDKVTATGTKSTFSNEIELKATDVQKIGTTSVPAPVEVTPTTANQYPGQLVTLSDVKVSDLADVDTYGSFSFNANSGSDKISVYVDDRTGITKDVVKNDDTIDVTGIVAPNGSDFEIKPAGTDAITVVSDAGDGDNPPTDPITPLPNGTGKKVLFDNTHGETAGAADWVPDGGFSDFANGLKADGFTVAELDRPMPIDFSQPAITLDKLEQYDVFVLGEANIPFKASEQEAMKEYVEQGGSIFFIGDHYNSDRNLNRWDSGEVYNGFRRGAFDDPTKGMSTEEANSGAMKDVAPSSDWLSDTFGVRFRGNAIGTVTSGETFAPEADSFGINNGVKSVEMHDGSTLAITDPTKAKGLVYLPKLTEADKSAFAVDQGVYNGGGVDEGPMAAIAKVGEGKAAFIGDSSPVEGGTPKYLREDTGKAKSDYPGFTSEGDDSTFLINLMNWLGEEDDDYTSFQGKIKLDQPTPLLHTATVDETPSKTTEPEKEPWSDPIAGYKWYDPSTFAAGSYGSPKAVQSNPKFSFEHQDTLPNEAPFQIRLDVTDLAAGQNLDNLQVGIYNPDGGAQIAKFKDSDGNWASGYGYSNKFSVTADTAGNAHIDLDVELDPSYTGDARLRLKSNGDAVVTENVTVGNVEVTPLDPYQVPVPAQSSISDARKAASGTLVTVDGVVTTKPGIWGGEGFYLQDATGGIYVYQSTSNYHLGQKVKLSGTVSPYNGELELSNLIDSHDEGDGTIPSPTVVKTVNDDNQGQLLKVQGVTVKNIGTPDSYGTFEFDAVNGDTTTRVRVDSRSGINYTDFTAKYKEDDKLDLTGVGSVFNGAYLLKPRSADDITAASTGTGGSTDNGSGNTGNGGSTDNGNGNSGNGGSTDNGGGNTGNGGSTDNGSGNSGNGGSADNGNGNTGNGGSKDNGSGNTGNGGSADNGNGNSGNGGSTDNGSGSSGNGGSADNGNGNSGSPNKGGSNDNSGTIKSVTVTPGSETAVAVKAGETLKISGTNAQVILPSNLPAGTTVKVEKLDQQSSEVKMANELELAGDVYHFDFAYPNGRLFTGDFTLTLKYDAAHYSADQVGIYYFNETTQKWELLKGTVNASNGTITVHVKHFSTYGVFAKKATSGSSTTSTSKGATNGSSHSSLPVTSTPYPNYVLSGLLLALFGTMALIVRRRSNKKIKA